MKYLIAFCLFFSSVVTIAAGPSVTGAPAKDFTTTCKPFPAPLSGGYCIHKPSLSNSTDVLYHFHGKGGSERDWEDANYYPQQIRDFWKTHRMHAPTVVSVSFGPVWILAKKNSSPVSGMMDVFIQSALPLIEKDLGFRSAARRRLLIGESMGGFNATQVLFHHRIFQKVAILCAPIAQLSPFASPKDVDDFVHNSKAWQYHHDQDPAVVSTAVGEMIQLGQTFFPTPTEWEAADPLTLSTKTTARNMAAVYLAAGLHDKYALYEGNEAFQKSLLSKGISVEWRPQWGGHCAMDIPSLARFLVW